MRGVHLAPSHASHEEEMVAGAVPTPAMAPPKAYAEYGADAKGGMGATAAPYVGSAPRVGAVLDTSDWEAAGGVEE